MFDLQDVSSVSPALDRYTQDSLLGEVWKRPDLPDRAEPATAVHPEQNQPRHHTGQPGRALAREVEALLRPNT
jgi:hypothetical protein